jgi:hypothetical protein
MLGEKVKIKTWMGFKDGVVKRVCKKHLIVILDGLPVKFSLKTMLAIGVKGNNPPRLILDMKEYERDQLAREQWEKLSYPGLEKFELIKEIIGKKQWKKEFPPGRKH